MHVQLVAESCVLIGSLGGSSSSTVCLAISRASFCKIARLNRGSCGALQGAAVAVLDASGGVSREMTADCTEVVGRHVLAAGVSFVCVGVARTARADTKNKEIL